MKILVSFYCTIIFLNLQAQSNNYTTQSKNDLTSIYVNLCARMTGSFSSEAQSKIDTDYFDIRLHMVHIWEKRTDGYWLYVEQAVADYIDKPYRQRLYRVINNNDSTFTSEVYEFATPLQYAGAWKNIAILDSLNYEKLELRDGCAITLKWNAEDLSFTGQTGNKTCPSSRSGASYATSHVKIYEDKLISWDQGFNDKGEQVWGATKGGYIFIKQME